MPHHLVDKSFVGPGEGCRQSTPGEVDNKVSDAARSAYLKRHYLSDHAPPPIE